MSPATISMFLSRLLFRKSSKSSINDCTTVDGALYNAVSPIVILFISKLILLTFIPVVFNLHVDAFAFRSDNNNNNKRTLLGEV